LIDGRWLLRDGVDNRFDKIFQSIDEFSDNYWKKSSNRFEIMEIDFDIEQDVQGVFCSKEKFVD